jgi:hypothetical protein
VVSLIANGLTGEEIAGRVAELQRSSSFDAAPVALR